MRTTKNGTARTAAFAMGLAISVAAAAETPGPVVTVADLAGFTQTVAPFLARHCQHCHGPKRAEAELTLHAIDGNLADGPDIATWKLVAERLALNEMPPEGQPRPDARSAAAVLEWIKAEMTKAGEDASGIARKLQLPGHGNRVDHAALFSGQITAPTASPARLWRMRPQSYVSFVPRIAGSTARVGQPYSTHSGEGFKDYAELFLVDEPTINQLLRNARQLAEMQCGLARQSKPVKEFQALVDPQKPPTREQIAAALRRQFHLVLLREPSDDDLSRFTALMQSNLEAAGQPIGAANTLAAVMLLPEAMYRFELGHGEPDKHGRRLLSPRELAYAVSLALTDDGPDLALLKAAETGQLSSAADVRREVERILADARIAKPRIMRFFEEYFEFPAAQDVFKDLNRGQWRPEILIADTRYLIQHLLDEDRDVLKQLLTTNKAFVNYRVDAKRVATAAKPVKKQEIKIDKKTGKPQPPPPRQPEIHDYYGLPEDWEWTAEQPIELPPDQRAGVLTQPSWLSAFATNNENHAIRRGKWVRERLLGGVVPDLPISVDAQLPESPEQTLRQRMAVTRQAYCWQCHQKMNPLGLTFEHYDYLGRFRAVESVLDPEATAKQEVKQGQTPTPVMRDIPIDASGLVEGAGDPRIEGGVADAVEMINKLADSPRVRQVFVRHAFRFWMGRNETLHDAPTLLAADQAYVKSGGSMRALVTSLLTSDSFLYRK